MRTLSCFVDQFIYSVGGQGPTAHGILTRYVSRVNGTVLVIFAVIVENHCKSARVKGCFAFVPEYTTDKGPTIYYAVDKIYFANTI